MSADELAEFWVHTTTIETFTGEDAFGKHYAPTSEPVPCFIADKRRLIRNRSGDTEISETTITANRRYASLFTEGSIAHLPERDAVVLKLADNSSGDLGLPDHMEAFLS